MLIPTRRYGGVELTLPVENIRGRQPEYAHQIAYAPAASKRTPMPTLKGPIPAEGSSADWPSRALSERMIRE